MSKCILAALTGNGSDHAVVETAIAAAWIEGGHVTCMHTHADPIETAAALEVAFFQFPAWETVQQIEKQEAIHSRNARKTFEEACARHGLSEAPAGESGLSVSWKESRSFSDETLAESRYHDLVVSAREPDVSPRWVRTLLMHAGRPLLLAAAKPPAALGRNVAIAWKDGEEAARAVTAAETLLRQAERVRILVAAREEEVEEAQSAAHLAKMLLRKGIKAETLVECAEAGRETATLQNMAYNCEADLLVMGAYGHSRFREAVLGGVTAGMLRECAIPLFLFK